MPLCCQRRNHSLRSADSLPKGAQQVLKEGDRRTPSFARGSESGFPKPVNLGFQGGPDSKESACSAGDRGSIPGWGKAPGGEHGTPLQCSSWRTPRTEGPGATVHGSQRVNRTEPLTLSLSNLRIKL